jgi:hypothetical protein
MTMMVRPSVGESVETFPLLSALRGRRSRRFARGASLDGGPLSYRSATVPEPLTLEEEASLAFAAAGITGHTLAELPYAAGVNPESSCGNIIVHLLGRTVPSGDALHSVMLFVLNDQGTWLIRRPQDLTSADLSTVVAAGQNGRLVDAYTQLRVPVSSARASVARAVPQVPPFNIWDTNLPGTTLFLPVTEFTSLYINVLLTAFSDSLSYYILDDHAGYRPAGLSRFARSRGGHLYDNPNDGRVLTVGFLETALASIAAAEEGAMHQSLGLMAEALGLGGFTHACRHPDWLNALGFEMRELPFSRMAALPWWTRMAMWLLRKPDPLIQVPIGLPRPGATGEWLVRPYIPPHFTDMRAAVMAFIDYKFAAGTGTLAGEGPSAWREGGTVRAHIDRYSPQAIEATVAYCEYIYERYGRFPHTIGPFENILAYQAHHVDVSFYDTFYTPEVLGHRQRTHAHE